MHEQEAVDDLTPREEEILKGTAQGKSAKEIAQDLSISTRTVENHRNNAYSKLGVHNKVQAAVYYVAHYGFANEEDEITEFE